MVTNYELRLRARKALKGNWQIALMVALIASLPSLISQVVAIMGQTSSMDAMYGLMDTIGRYPTADVTEIIGRAGFSSRAYLVSGIVNLVAELIAPFLTLGMLNYMLRLLRGEEALIGTVFSRTGCFFKGIGLLLMIGIRELLWMLPGLAVMLASVLLVNLSETLAIIILYVGMIAMIVLGVRAALHYSMATRIMADRPDVRIMQCIRESVEIMSQRKMMLFSLQLSFIGYSLLLMLAQSLIAVMVGNILASTLYMLFNLALTVYIQTATCAFYEEYRPHDGGPLTDVEQQVV